MKKLLALTACIVVTALLGVPAQAGGGHGPVYAPGADVNGAPYRHWVGRWEIWINEIPLDVNPAADPSSVANCALQPGGVVFTGPFGADCVVPEGAPVLVPLFGWECSTAEGLGDTYRQLRRCAGRNFLNDFDPDSFRVRVNVDGERIRNARRWTFTSPKLIIDFPRENLWGAVPGPSKAVSKEVDLILKPLVEGDHKVVLRVSSSVFGEIRFVWKLHVDPYTS